MTQPSAVRWQNRAFILRALTQGDLTRSQLACTTGISKVTVTSIVNDLLQQGLLREFGQQRHQGRPAGRVGLAGNIATALGVDVQPRLITTACGDLRGNAQSTARKDVEPHALTDALVSAIDAVRLAAPSGPLVQVIVAVPAPTDGVTLHEPNAVPELDTNRVLGWAAQHEIHVRFENDANLSALAEHRTGAARDADPFAVLIERDSGLGLGLFLRGSLYRGQRGRAGELGEVRWPDCGNAPNTLLEALSQAQRYDALAYLLGFLAATLDLNLLVLNLDENDTLARHVRDIVPPSVGVRTGAHGNDGPVTGALLMAVEEARDAVFSTSTEVLI